MTDRHTHTKTDTTKTVPLATLSLRWVVNRKTLYNRADNVCRHCLITGNISPEHCS